MGLCPFHNENPSFIVNSARSRHSNA
ncbi:hypothetical protein KCP70_03355 [Salmonella enterica subsp. enterica]|nr:hypothetical protein KCP70_03355 [Salmonella enterica subsp. enterica]